LRDVKQQIAHLVDALTKGIKSESVQKKLKSLEEEEAHLSQRVEELELLPRSENPIPSDEWMAEQMRALSTLLMDHQSGAISICREILGDIIAEEIKSPGKRRGYIRLRIQLQTRQIMNAVMQKAIPASALAMLDTEIPTDKGEEILLDLGRPTRMDEWAPQIVEWRKQQMPWHEIARRTGLQIQNAYTAWKRYVNGGGRAA
jgi:hypothetical protein